jgi:uncharacterized protein
MHERLLAESGGAKTFVVILDTHDTVSESLLAFARTHAIRAASLSGIGALESVTLGYFDPPQRDYKRITINEQVEVLSLIGNFAAGDDGPKLHAHVVVGKIDGTAHGGHLLDARVRPTLELVIVETPAYLKRRSDPATGLALIDLRTT